MTIPSELSRKRLDKRAQEQIALINNQVPERLRKTPSQKKSESGRKKFLKRAGIAADPPIPCDCFGCSKEPCGKTLNECEERAMVHRCWKCGVKVRHRIDPVKVWEYCPVCRS